MLSPPVVQMHCTILSSYNTLSFSSAANNSILLITHFLKNFLKLEVSITNMSRKGSEPSPADYRLFGIIVLWRAILSHLQALLVLFVRVVDRPLTENEREQIMAEYESIGQILNEYLGDLTR